MTEYNDEHWMAHAISLAQKAEQQGEVPVGAVIVQDNVIIGEGWNQPIMLNDASAHAEIQAIRAACQHIDNYRLVDATMYVTLEPCVMCAGAIIHARIKRVVFATTEPKTGAVGSCLNLFDMPQFNHRVNYHQGIMAQQSGDMLRAFFQQRR